MVHPFKRPTPSFPIGVKPLPLGRAQPTARLVLIGPVKCCSGGENPPPTFRWPKDRSVCRDRQTQLVYTHASQILRGQSSTEPARGKTSAPVLPLVGRIHRSPFTSPHPAIHSFHTITGSIGIGWRLPIGRQDCPPLTRDRDRSLTLMSSLFLCDESRTTSHRCRRLLRNANRPPKRILPCACATNPGTRPFLRPLRLRKTRHNSRHYAGAVGSPPSPARHFTCFLSQAELLNAPA